MSTHYKAYFHLNSKIIYLDRLKTFLDDYQLQYEDRISCFFFEEGILLEKPDNTYVDWQQFTKEINELKRSVNSEISHELCYMYLGFFVTLEKEKWAVLHISARNLGELSNYILKPKGFDVLHFLIAIYQVLEADAMVWGVEYTFETALAFLKGSIEKEDVENYIRAAFGALPVHSLELLGAGRGYDIFIHGVKGYISDSYLPWEAN
jgi:hypothetical protein